jgi:hypothetical protein
MKEHKGEKRFIHIGKIRGSHGQFVSKEKFMEMPQKFDYTMLSNFLTCRRKYYYRIVQSIVSKKPPTAAEFGRCIHLALDEWFKSHDMEKGKQIFRNVFVPDPEDEKRTVPVAMKLLDLYAEKYEYEGFKVLASEKTFIIPFAGLKGDIGERYLIGRIDKIIDWDGVIYVMDHKTTSRLGAEFFYKIKPNMQFDGYILGARSLGYPTCSGAVMDALLVAKGLLTSSQLSRLTPLARDISTRTEEELLEYMWDTVDTLHDMRICYETGRWHRNTESCCDFIECPYRRICKEEEGIRKNIIESDFMLSPWDPMKQLEVIE